MRWIRRLGSLSSSPVSRAPGVGGNAGRARRPGAVRRLGSPGAGGGVGSARVGGAGAGAAPGGGGGGGTRTRRYPSADRRGRREPIPRRSPAQVPPSSAAVADSAADRAG